MEKFEQFMYRVDYHKYNIINKYRNFKIDTSNRFVSIFRSAMNNKGLSILILSILLSILTGDKFTYFFWGTILYLLIHHTNRIKEEKKSDKLKDIDFKLLGAGEESLSAILDQFIADCFNRDVIFFRGIKDKEYINDKDEKEMLNSLLNSVASGLSPILRDKLELYYGDQLDRILARKCFITVSLFVANNNKNIYNTPNQN